MSTKPEEDVVEYTRTCEHCGGTGKITVDATLDQIADAAIKDLVDRVNESNDEVFANTVRGNEVFSPEMAEKVKPMLRDVLPAGLTDRILKRLTEHEQELKASDPEAYARYLKRVGALADLLDVEKKKLPEKL